MNRKQLKLLQKRSATKKALKEQQKQTRQLWNGYRPAIMQDKRYSKKQEQKISKLKTEESL